MFAPSPICLCFTVYVCTSSSAVLCIYSVAAPAVQILPQHTSRASIFQYAGAQQSKQEVKIFKNPLNIDLFSIPASCLQYNM